MNRLLQPIAFVRPIAITFVCVVVLFGSIAFGQDAPGLPQLNIIDQLGIPGLGEPSGGEEATFTAKYQVAEGTRQGRLSVTATIQPAWHLYSVTQLPGGPMRSEIKLASTDQAKLIGQFNSDVAPRVKQYEFFDVPVEEHDGAVVWTAPIQLAEGIDPTSTELQLKFNGQVCQDEGACIPIANKPIVAKFAGYYKAEPTVTEFKSDAAHVTLRGAIESTSAAPGQAVTLTLAAEPESPWHIYAYAKQDPKLLSKPTLIAITEPSGWRASEVTASSQPIEHETEMEEQPLAYFHEESVRWSFDIAIPADTAPGTYTVAGLIGYQTCTLSQCDMPTAAAFRGMIEVGAETVAGESLLTFTAAKYDEVVRLTAEPTAPRAEPSRSPDGRLATQPINFWEEVYKKLQFEQVGDGWSHPWFGERVFAGQTLVALALTLLLTASLLGGLILNVMPCVLPVIGLKIMSFVQQAGQSRWRVFNLNLWYSLGLISVFLAFATFAAVLHLLGRTFAWGEHMGDPRFAIPLLSLVFVLGLSMFGVWEIPIPGFVGSGKASDAGAKEGPLGAFLKGILTTILATPCTGPFMGVAVGLAVIAPIWLNYLIFFTMGLGMAMPYLVIGAFPSLVRVLPKPGAWMEGFKQAMGFVLMGTAVWIINVLEQTYVVPTLALLIGLGMSCWILGGTPITAAFAAKFRRWCAATTVGLLALILFMGLQTDDTTELPWQRYTRATLDDYRGQGKTILVDFTADW